MFFPLANKKIPLQQRDFEYKEVQKIMLPAPE
jgi:hypothetical protein